MDTLLDELSLVKGVALGRDAVFLLMAIDELAKSEDSAHSVFVLYESGHAQLLDQREGWCAGVASIPDRPRSWLGVGEYGKALVLGDAGSSEEDIGIPDNCGPLRDVVTIGSSVYAVGAHRQVYRREQSGVWGDVRGDLPRGEGSDGATFESISGFGEDEIYACGWDGEIWFCDKGKWRACQTPTNLILSDIFCAGDGLVYACGQGGTIVHGRGDQWSILQSSEVVSDLWSVRWFFDQIYTASMSQMFQLHNDEMTLCAGAISKGRTFFSLSIAENTLWSIGAKDLIRFDGDDWSRISEVTAG